MIRRILILLAVLALCLSGLSASAEDAFEAGELHVYRVSMDENETVPVRWYKDTPSFPFMGIRAYYRMMFGEELGFAREGGLVTLTAPDGSTAVWGPDEIHLSPEAEGRRPRQPGQRPPALSGREGRGQGAGNLADGA